MSDLAELLAGMSCWIGVGFIVFLVGSAAYGIGWVIGNLWRFRFSRRQDGV